MDLGSSKSQKQFPKTQTQPRTEVISRHFNCWHKSEVKDEHTLEFQSISTLETLKSPERRIRMSKCVKTRRSNSKSKGHYKVSKSFREYSFFCKIRSQKENTKVNQKLNGTIDNGVRVHCNYINYCEGPLSEHRDLCTFTPTFSFR